LGGQSFYLVWRQQRHGGLNLTIADRNGNVLAQSTAYIQIVDIKQMYERWTVGDIPTNAPVAVPYLVSDNSPLAR